MQGSQLNEKVRNCKVSNLKCEKKKKFKYFVNSTFQYRLQNLKLELRRKLNTQVQKPILWLSIHKNIVADKVKIFLSQFDLLLIKNDVSVWLFESFIEGLTANFVTHFLFGIKFNFFILMAHGIFIKQGLDIYSRIKLNGSNSKIQKNK